MGRDLKFPKKRSAIHPDAPPAEFASFHVWKPAVWFWLPLWEVQSVVCPEAHSCLAAFVTSGSGEH